MCTTPRFPRFLGCNLSAIPHGVAQLMSFITTGPLGSHQYVVQMVRRPSLASSSYATSSPTPQMRTVESSEHVANIWGFIGFQCTQLTVMVWPYNGYSSSPVDLMKMYTWSMRGEQRKTSLLLGWLTLRSSGSKISRLHTAAVHCRHSHYTITCLRHEAHVDDDDDDDNLT